MLDLVGEDVSHVNDSYSIKPLFTDESAQSARVHSYTEKLAELEADASDAYFP